ncbi:MULTISPECIES: radical SAM family heme chaperone HemW [Halocynthiibacter]|uniref:Heme chaperone HemW n=1 Tax=Halocynthiibacter halioticoli TaxID=2986804 RepID=A0AAE3J2G2_9RHOB|nr:MULTISPECIES: radical SAM family heme chaperone HemW [Halocynthiibacter]MCV6825605.1 radical SAM family heme chaperone HemW [Halocynthiibacter halioticoli]MCW4058606.1 radical SAM family heme chaperone HemW [Halocynthiibacter sp. SDUM655004]
MEDWQNGGFGFYVHWPFCMAKCPYCDFNSHVSKEIDQKQWRSAYLSEIDRVAEEIGPRTLNTIYFGGGTPSLMDPDLVAAIIERIRTHWPTANDFEVTLEANPTSIEAGRFQGYRDGGVSRISMGYQALNDEDLRRLGRMHTAKEGMEAFEIAKNAFDRVSFDLIYARQDQTLDAWRDELTRALELSIDHLSLYQLTIEQGTAFGDRYERGKLRGLPSEDLATDMFFVTQELCDKAGMSAYEVSNHAKLGSESRHNLVYWRYGDYAGIGPGAHGRITVNGQKIATETLRQPEAWLQAVEKSSNGETERDIVSKADQASEMLMMGLRLSEGVSLERFSALSGSKISSQTLENLSEMGMLLLDGDRLRATPQGRVILNALLRELLVDI